MTELEAIIEAADAARKRAQPALLATVVRVRGSAYRRPGARMLLTPDGWQAGCISGGCLEGDIVRKAWWRTESGAPVVVTYDSTLEDEAGEDDELSWGLGLGCNGIVEVLLERLVPPSDNAPAADPIAFIAECLRRNQPGVLATVIAPENPARIGQRVLWHSGDAHPAAVTVSDAALAEQIARDARQMLAEGGAPSRAARYAGADVFLETITPPATLLICGASHDAAPLARLASTVGWRVTVVDPRPAALPHPERFPGADVVLACAPPDLHTHIGLDVRTFAVVMSHNVAHDAALLAALLPSPVGYIGVLGPRRRTERLLASLRKNGDMGDDDRVHGPVGLDIGADTPEAIALAILAEMQAITAGRAGGFLRERGAPIHAPSEEPRGSVNSPKPRGEAVECALTT